MQALLAIAVGLLALIMVGVWVVLYQLARQQGRLLLRLDHVEERLRAHHLTNASGESLAVRHDAPRLPGGRPLSESRIERHGLPPGTPAPAFRLPDLKGRMVSLAEYRGRRVLLVFTDPRCSPCDELAPRLVRLHREHRDTNVRLVMVGRGDSEENRRKAEEHGIEFPVVLQQRWELSKQYGIFATPVAFLISEDAMIEAKVARGADEVLVLAGRLLAAEKEKGDGHAI